MTSWGDTHLLDSRTKRLDSFSYKLNEGGQFGLDVSFGAGLAIDEAKMAVAFPFADGNRRDGVGDLLEISGIKTERHRLNPVVLFDHGKTVTLPVALAEDPDTKAYTVELDAAAKQARVKAFFYQGKGFGSADRNGDHALFCEQLFDLICRRYIRAGSIGYQAVKAYQLPANPETGVPQGLHLLVTNLLEASAVVVPANQDTVLKALALPKICGKPPSPYLIKSLAPYAPARKAQMAWDGKADKEPRADEGIHYNHPRYGGHNEFDSEGNQRPRTVGSKEENDYRHFTFGNTPDEPERERKVDERRRLRQQTDLDSQRTRREVPKEVDEANNRAYELLQEEWRRQRGQKAIDNPNHLQRHVNEPGAKENLDEALELQKTTGADLSAYIAREHQRNAEDNARFRKIEEANELIRQKRNLHALRRKYRGTKALITVSREHDEEGNENYVSTYHLNPHNYEGGKHPRWNNSGRAGPRTREGAERTARTVKDTLESRSGVCNEPSEIRYNYPPSSEREAIERDAINNDEAAKRALHDYDEEHKALMVVRENEDGTYHVTRHVNPHDHPEGYPQPYGDSRVISDTYTNEADAGDFAEYTRQNWESGMHGLGAEPSAVRYAQPARDQRHGLERAQRHASDDTERELLRRAIHDYDEENKGLVSGTKADSEGYDRHDLPPDAPRFFVHQGEDQLGRYYEVVHRDLQGRPVANTDERMQYSDRHAASRAARHLNRHWREQPPPPESKGIKADSEEHRNYNIPSHYPKARVRRGSDDRGYYYELQARDATGRHVLESNDHQYATPAAANWSADMINRNWHDPVSPPGSLEVDLNDTKALRLKYRGVKAIIRVRKDPVMSNYRSITAHDQYGNEIYSGLVENHPNLIGQITSHARRRVIDETGENPSTDERQQASFDDRNGKALDDQTGFHDETYRQESAARAQRYRSGKLTAADRREIQQLSEDTGLKPEQVMERRRQYAESVGKTGDKGILRVTAGPFIGSHEDNPNNTDHRRFTVSGRGDSNQAFNRDYHGLRKETAEDIATTMRVVQANDPVSGDPEDEFDPSDPKYRDQINYTEPGDGSNAEVWNKELGYQNRLSNTKIPPARWRAGNKFPSDWWPGAGAVKNLRLKYRGVKGIFRIMPLPQGGYQATHHHNPTNSSAGAHWSTHVQGTNLDEVRSGAYSAARHLRDEEPVHFDDHTQPAKTTREAINREVIQGKIPGSVHDDYSQDHPGEKGISRKAVEMRQLANGTTQIEDAGKAGDVPEHQRRTVFVTPDSFRPQETAQNYAEHLIQQSGQDPRYTKPVQRKGIIRTGTEPFTGQRGDNPNNARHRTFYAQETEDADQGANRTHDRELSQESADHMARAMQQTDMRRRGIRSPIDPEDQEDPGADWARDNPKEYQDWLNRQGDKALVRVTQRGVPSRFQLPDKKRPENQMYDVVMHHEPSTDEDRPPPASTRDSLYNRGIAMNLAHDLANIYPGSTVDDQTEEGRRGKALHDPVNAFRIRSRHRKQPSGPLGTPAIAMEPGAGIKDIRMKYRGEKGIIRTGTEPFHGWRGPNPNNAEHRTYQAEETGDPNEGANRRYSYLDSQEVADRYAHIMQDNDKLEGVHSPIDPEDQEDPGADWARDNPKEYQDWLSRQQGKGIIRITNPYNPAQVGYRERFLVQARNNQGQGYGQSAPRESKQDALDFARQWQSYLEHHTDERYDIQDDAPSYEDKGIKGRFTVTNEGNPADPNHGERDIFVVRARRNDGYDHGGALSEWADKQRALEEAEAEANLFRHAHGETYTVHDDAPSYEDTKHLHATRMKYRGKGHLEVTREGNPASVIQGQRERFVVRSYRANGELHQGHGSFADKPMALYHANMLRGEVGHQLQEGREAPAVIDKAPGYEHVDHGA